MAALIPGGEEQLADTPGYSLTTRRMDEDGVWITTTKTREAQTSFVAGGSTNSPIVTEEVTGGVWVKRWDEPISDLLVWRIVESRPVPAPGGATAATVTTEGSGYLPSDQIALTGGALVQPANVALTSYVIQSLGGSPYGTGWSIGDTITCTVATGTPPIITITGVSAGGWTTANITTAGSYVPLANPTWSTNHTGTFTGWAFSNLLFGIVTATVIEQGNYAIGSTTGVTQTKPPFSGGTGAIFTITGSITRILDEIKGDEDGVEITAERSFQTLSQFQTLSPIEAVSGGIWTFYTFEPVSDMVGWQRKNHRTVPGVAIASDRYDELLGPVAIARTLVADSSQTAGLTATSKTTYQERTGSSVVFWQVVETYSDGTGSAGNPAYPIVTSHQWDNVRGDIQQTTQLVVKSGSQPATLVTGGGNATLTQYEEYNPFLMKKTVQTWAIPANLLKTRTYDDARGAVTQSRQLIIQTGSEAASIAFSTPTATKTTYEPYAPAILFQIIETWALPGPQLSGSSLDKEHNFGIPYTKQMLDATSAGALIGDANIEVTPVDAIESEVVTHSPSDAIIEAWSLTLPGTANISVPDQLISLTALSSKQGGDGSYTENGSGTSVGDYVSLALSLRDSGQGSAGVTMDVQPVFKQTWGQNLPIAIVLFFAKNTASSLPAILTKAGAVLGKFDGTYTGNAQDGVTNTDHTFSSASANFSASDVGASIAGTNIAGSSTIATVVDSQNVTLNNATTGTGTSLPFTIARTVTAWPVFKPVQNTITIMGSSVSLQAQATAHAALSESAANVSEVTGSGGGTTNQWGITMRSMQLPPTIHGSITMATSGSAYTLNNFFLSVTVTNGGTEYLASGSGEFTVLVTGGGGSGASLTAVVTSGVITAVQVDDAGSGYTSTPTLDFATNGAQTGGGVAATATSNISSTGIAYDAKTCSASAFAAIVGEGSFPTVADAGSTGSKTAQASVSPITLAATSPSSVPTSGRTLNHPAVELWQLGYCMVRLEIFDFSYLA